MESLLVRPNVGPHQHRSLRIRLAHQIADELTNAFVIEENRHASRADVNGHAVADYQGVRMVYFEIGLR